MVEIENLHKCYGKLEAVKGASLKVGRGEAHFIIGPSGCGKSTLLRCINLLEEPTRGMVRVGDTAMRFGEGAKSMSAARTGAVSRSCRHGLPAIPSVSPHDRAGERDGGSADGQAPAGSRSFGDRRRAAGEGGIGREARRLSQAPVWRPGAACRHCPRAGDGAGSRALRRGHVGTGPRARRRGTGGHSQAHAKRA